ncbi:Hypothetical predicted protein [Cloeon dipterum]|uniref:Uncharacterized protein n=1 Tax=Cloeon dipterum TaxID=197152 RepID=A0A8S1E426_9INSE|nr:Hypothetical predicted protein [Cloeon dipterum]
MSLLSLDPVVEAGRRAQVVPDSQGAARAADGLQAGHWLALYTCYGYNLYREPVLFSCRIEGNSSVDSDLVFYLSNKKYLYCILLAPARDGYGFGSLTSWFLHSAARNWIR